MSISAARLGVLRETRAGADVLVEADDINTKMSEALKQRGLLSRAGAMISLAPPLCITRAEVDEVVGIVDEAIGDVEQQFGIA
ncbi:MAG: hypothetical protein ACRDJE_02665 [Dehalococcoidia bacterium]